MEQPWLFNVFFGPCTPDQSACCHDFDDLDAGSSAEYGVVQAKHEIEFTSETSTQTPTSGLVLTPPASSDESSSLADCIPMEGLRTRATRLDKRQPTVMSENRFLANRPGRQKPTNCTLSCSSLYEECQLLPPPSVPKGVLPVTKTRLDGVTIAEILEALQAKDGPVQEFMREVLGFWDFETTPWKSSVKRKQRQEKAETGVRSRIAETFFGRRRYRAPVPPDVPKLVGKLLGMPQSLDATTLYHLGCSEDEIVLVQQSYVKGIMHVDPHMQNTFAFTKDEAGGVLLRQWVDVIWVGNLPLALRAAKVFVEKKLRAEAKATFQDFARIVRNAALQQGLQEGRDQPLDAEIEPSSTIAPI